MPLQAAFQLQSQEDLRYGGGGHLASTYQFVNRGGYLAERPDDLAGSTPNRFLYRFFKGLAWLQWPPEHTQNIVRVTR